MEFGSGTVVVTDLGGEEAAAALPASKEYLAHWHHLVSTTNWQKGRIISQWRAALIDAGEPQPSYSDEAWSRLVGNVSGQHVGRLRRVYDRFGAQYQQYPGLFWSHFQVALDWDDAEMWLEGAVQNSWSVAQMRGRRAETLGLAPGDDALADPAATTEVDEDSLPPADTAARQVDDRVETIHDAQADDGDSVDEHAFQPDGGGDAPFDAESYEVADSAEEGRSVPVRPFENMPQLPPDMADAFELFKLAILSHKLTAWQEVSSESVLAALDALKALVTAPSQD